MKYIFLPLPLILEGSYRKLFNFWLAFCQNWNNLKVMRITEKTARPNSKPTAHLIWLERNSILRKVNEKKKI